MYVNEKKCTYLYCFIISWKIMKGCAFNSTSIKTVKSSTLENYIERQHTAYILLTNCRPRD